MITHLLLFFRFQGHEFDFLSPELFVFNPGGLLGEKHVVDLSRLVIACFCRLLLAAFEVVLTNDAPSVHLCALIYLCG